MEVQQGKGRKHGNGRNKGVWGKASSLILDLVYEYALELH